MGGVFFYHRTIFGIETHERKIKLVPTINRTIFGIETRVKALLNDPTTTINRNIFGIETRLFQHPFEVDKHYQSHHLWN